MPRYYFHICGDSPDSDGTELSDLTAVRTEAIKTAGEILRDLNGKLPIGKGWEMNVADPSGLTLFTLRFCAEGPV